MFSGLLLRYIARANFSLIQLLYTLSSLVRIRITRLFPKKTQVERDREPRVSLRHIVETILLNGKFFRVFIGD